MSFQEGELVEAWDLAEILGCLFFDQSLQAFLIMADELEVESIEKEAKYSRENTVETEFTQDALEPFLVLRTEGQRCQRATAV